MCSAECHVNTVQALHVLRKLPVGLLQRLKLLLPLLLGLSFSVLPGQLCSSPILSPLQLPFAQLGLPLALGLLQAALPLPLKLAGPLLAGCLCLCHLACPVPACSEQLFYCCMHTLYSGFLGGLAILGSETCSSPTAGAPAYSRAWFSTLHQTRILRPHCQHAAVLLQGSGTLPSYLNCAFLCAAANGASPTVVAA